MLRRFTILALFFLTFTFLSSPPSLFAQPQDWSNVPNTSGRCVSKIDSEVATIQGFECLFYNILQVIAVVAGLVFFVMFIVGGFQYLLSSNDQKAVAQASNTLTMAFIAIVGVILSWIVLLFVTNFTGISVLQFLIPGPN